MLLRGQRPLAVWTRRSTGWDCLCRLSAQTRSKRLGLTLQWPWGGQDKRRKCRRIARPLPEYCRRDSGPQARFYGPKGRSGTLTQKRSIVQSSIAHAPNSHTATARTRNLGGPRSPATEQPGIEGLRISPPDNGGCTTPATCSSQRLPHATTRQESRRVANESWQGKESPHISPNLCDCQVCESPRSSSADSLFLGVMEWVVWRGQRWGAGVDGLLLACASSAPVHGWLYADRRRRLWYGRGVVCTGHDGRWRAWLPGCADEFRGPGRCARSRGCRRIAGW
jgi:hypothetical protein